MSAGELLPVMQFWRDFYKADAEHPSATPLQREQRLGRYYAYSAVCRAINEGPQELEKAAKSFGWEGGKP